MSQVATRRGRSVQRQPSDASSGHGRPAWLPNALQLVRRDGVASALAWLQEQQQGGLLDGATWVACAEALAGALAGSDPRLALALCEGALASTEASVGARLLAGSMQDKLGQRVAAKASMKAVVESPSATPLQVIRASNLLVRLGEQALAASRAVDAFNALGRPLEHAATLLYIAQVTADWSLVEQLTEQLRQGYADGQLELINESPRTHLLWCDDETLNLQVLKLWSKNNLRIFRDTVPAAKPPQGRRLRVGYLSSDFREHPTSRLILGVLRHHDRAQVELFMYCSGWDDGSTLRKEVVEQFDHVHSVAALNDEAAAALIRSHQIDVLVELNGPTRAHRMGILGHRPAPVQIDYLGWPGSVGGRVVDYVVGDIHTVPEGAEEFYPEKVIRLDHTYQANDHAAQRRPPKPGRREVGLPEDPDICVLGMFNAINKVHQQVWDTWMQIMQRAPHTILWMLDPGPLARKAIARAAKAAGVSTSRIIASPKLPQMAHLARLQCCDLMLDPWPYGGHTSTADALFAAVPVLAMQGRNFASRVSPGLLRAAGLEMLICSTPQEYMERALGLVQSPAELQRLHARLRESVVASPLFDSATRARQLEAAYRAAVERSAAGLPPIHLSPRSVDAGTAVVPGLGKDDAERPTTSRIKDVTTTSGSNLQAKFDFLMSSERDFAPYLRRPACRFLLCSTARSGSNLVSDMLQQTQLAGQPMEYLNGSYVAAHLRSSGHPEEADKKINVLAYLDALEKRRTSVNGWFGMKAHFEHIEGLWERKPELAQQLLKRFDCFVQLRRRDKLAQAVSLYRARVTQIWSSQDYRFMSDDDPRRSRAVPFNAERITRALADIVHQEAAWERCLNTLELPYSVFWYEDFVADYVGASARLLEVLGIPEAMDRVTAPSIQRQSEAKDPLLEKYRAFLGLGSDSHMEST